ncbi:hypothetical protein V3C99_017724 [Haemonchus contortus]|uniref:Ion_trans_2 domain-containing protein n=1 Tax=Haemonchus contortus TaxID=6289 RepID=A0A7I4Z6D3_HAECO|nr:Hypothetical protein CBG08159 [Haemonchus contortus]
MSAGDLPPRFQLALRRSLFFGICLCFWLLIGTLTLSLLSVVGQRRADVAGMVKLDTKRTELLNVLWAETISKPEADWAEMANQKLEIYEKALLNYLGYRDESDDRSLMGSLRKSFSLVTTIGPMNIGGFTTVGKAFAILYTLIGVPLCLLLVSQCGRMFTSIWEGRALMIPTMSFIFVSAIIYDIIEDGTDDVPFVDAIFSIFLQFSAIGEMESEFHGILPYTITIFGLAMMSALFSQMQHELERSIHGLEFTFSKIFSKFERWMSESRGSVNTNRIEEEDEEESDY